MSRRRPIILKAGFSGKDIPQHLLTPIDLRLVKRNGTIGCFSYKTGRFG
jgi:hypothetical protein